MVRCGLVLSQCHTWEDSRHENISTMLILVHANLKFRMFYSDISWVEVETWKTEFSVKSKLGFENLGEKHITC